MARNGINTPSTLKIGHDGITLNINSQTVLNKFKKGGSSGARVRPMNRMLAG
jgi:hypothetical protein